MVIQYKPKSKLSKQLQEFKLNNIDIHEASKIMFNDDAKLAGLYRILHDKNELNKFFLPVTKVPTIFLS